MCSIPRLSQFACRFKMQHTGPGKFDVNEYESNGEREGGREGEGEREREGEGEREEETRRCLAITAASDELELPPVLP